MSVIAAYNGEVGSDSMGVCEFTGVWLPQQKVFVINRELIVACAGQSITPERMNKVGLLAGDIIAAMEHQGATTAGAYDRMVDDKGNPATNHQKAFLQGLSEMEVFFVTKLYRYLVTDDTIVRFTNPVPLVNGSGGYVASTALLLGQSMTEAVQTAIDIAPLVRGEPQVVKQKALLKLRRPKAKLSAISKKLELR